MYRWTPSLKQSLWLISYSLTLSMIETNSEIFIKKRLPCSLRLLKKVLSQMCIIGNDWESTVTLPISVVIASSSKLLVFIAAEMKVAKRERTMIAEPIWIHFGFESSVIMLKPWNVVVWQNSLPVCKRSLSHPGSSSNLLLKRRGLT